MSSRENIQITGNSFDELKRSLNFAMQRIADRLDKIEGVRGTSTVESNLDLTGNSLVNVGNFDQNLGTEDEPQFGGLIIDGDLAVTGIIDGNVIRVVDTNSTVIHEFS